MIRNTAGTILLAATVTAAALTQATYVRAASKFDGNWSVVVYTRSGPCQRFGLRGGIRPSERRPRRRHLVRPSIRWALRRQLGGAASLSRRVAKAAFASGYLSAVLGFVCLGP
jgi:hypothetical protein